jgi:hypothetical protein
MTMDKAVSDAVRVGGFRHGLVPGRRRRPVERLWLSKLLLTIKPLGDPCRF